MEIRLKDEAKPKNPIMLPAIKFFCDILFLLVSLILCIAFFGMKEKPNEDIIDLNNFSHIFENNIDSKYNLLPSICNSKIYNMPIYPINVFSIRYRLFFRMEKLLVWNNRAFF